MLDVTRRHLTTADENRAFAQGLVSATPTSPAASRWATVVAFYAAIHYVNAYMREYLQIEPTHHNERSRLVDTIADLRPVGRNYTLLRKMAFDARYVAGFQINSEIVQELIDIDLELVRAAVLRGFRTDQ